MHHRVPHTAQERDSVKSEVVACSFRPVPRGCTLATVPSSSPIPLRAAATPRSQPYLRPPAPAGAPSVLQPPSGPLPQGRADPQLLLDYRCWLGEGRQALGTDYPPAIQTCLTRISGMTPEQVLATYGFPDLPVATNLHKRAHGGGRSNRPDRASSEALAVVSWSCLGDGCRCQPAASQHAQYIHAHCC